ncbi:hypothetical protein POG22_04255 [Geitlerinema sp. CS-897]|uniref:hypothetical protein n=1 Tax=Baaleninema simplex TaxID=2862350 RepID=UPI00034BCAD2|nr:hypothetical protein [Baaleninema simplex]MDC0832224.1 hypothetical protein [Geitlerinema sp. CS-897]
MGRKAKLKKLRKSAKTDPEAAKRRQNIDDTQFVKDLQRQGYDLKVGDRAPDIPESSPEPQV